MTFNLLKTLLLIYHFLVGQWLWMLTQIIICHILTYDICFKSLVVLMNVIFFHHIYDIDIWKLKNVVPSIVLGYYSQADLCILITRSKLSSIFFNWANLWCNSSSRIFFCFLKKIHQNYFFGGNVHLMFIFGCCR